MTDHDSDDLARRLVASPHWRWLPGMRCTDGAILVSLDDADGVPAIWFHDGELVPDNDMSNDEPALPDLRDACTLGGLLALVRDAWGDARIHVEPAVRRWAVGFSTGSAIAKGASEAEALVKALLAAPE